MNRILLLALVVGIIVSGCGKANTVDDTARAQAAADSLIIHKYLTDNNLNGVATEIKKTGEFYIIDTLGSGNPYFSSSTLVTVGYKGSLLGSSTTFIDNTAGFHPAFALGTVIMGWQLGLPYNKKGGTIRLIIPSGLAYGPYPQSDYNLPANAILDFTIKIYDISN
jgi:FKBP-type peptidyl-prolyl cis-trans isomerase FkpA